MHEMVLIIDFGSQYTQLIARRVRELNVYCEIHPYNKLPQPGSEIKGIIFSGSPHSVRDTDAPQVDWDGLKERFPILAVCYGAQYVAQATGSTVMASTVREYGRAHLQYVKADNNVLFEGINEGSQVWMSHGDTIADTNQQIELLASTDTVKVAAYKVKGLETYAIQFHPEVTHSTDGKLLLQNFLFKICGLKGDWTPAHFVEETVDALKAQLGNDNVILALSGGVDSSVAAMLLHKAIGKNLHCVFVDNGLLRQDEYEGVLEQYKHLGLNITGVNATERFLEALAGLTDPEQKRKAIGKTFIDVFDDAAHKVQNVKWLAQGTIYPDVIESVSVNGPSATIKSHHNVGGLPADMNLKVVEPLRTLFKDEVRRVGKELGLEAFILGRHPFPGPGLGIRIIGEVTAEKLRVLKQADAIFINALKDHGLYDKVWQAGAIYLPVQSVGVMGDERTYENVIALRAVESTDGMTADWCHLPYEVLAKVSNEIINKVKGINRVVYDISSKPPATIEWE